MLKTDFIDICFCVAYYSFVLLTSSSAVIDAATAAQGSEVAAEAVANVAILEQASLRTSCLIGAFLGAMVSICVRPAKEVTASQQWRDVGLRGVASMASAVILTPMFVRWMEWKPDVDVVVMASGVIAFLSVALIVELTPPLLAAIVKRAKAMLGASEKE